MPLEYLGFGTVDFTDLKGFFRSILEGNNTAMFTLDFKGLGLPSASYSIFSNSLGILTDGESSCARVSSGYCVLPKSCDNFNSLWQYSFKIILDSTTGQYQLLPLASIAADQTTKSGANVCYIYVEELDSSMPDAVSSVVFGQMFFQSFAMAYHAQNSTQLFEVTFAKNINALDIAYLGNQTYNNKLDPFKFLGDTLYVDTYYTMPNVGVQMTGLPSYYYPYFYFDFTTDNTVVWDRKCLETVTSSTETCDSSPTNVIS